VTNVSRRGLARSCSASAPQRGHGGGSDPLASNGDVDIGFLAPGQPGIDGPCIVFFDAEGQLISYRRWPASFEQRETILFNAVGRLTAFGYAASLGTIAAEL
jgi:hypothetical protein